jgi:hypothetical protein
MAKPQLADRLAGVGFSQGIVHGGTLWALRYHTSFNGMTLKVSEGVRRGVSKGVENGCRMPTLQVATPAGSHF